MTTAEEKLKEINRRYESFNRTEKALDDEQAAHIQKSKEFHAEFMEFITKVRNGGYILTSSGWVKEALCDDCCQFLSITEIEQNRVRPKPDHICTKYNTRVKHEKYHPRLMKCKGCLASD